MQRFRAACALAALDPEGPSWERVAPRVANRLVVEDFFQLPLWIKGFAPVCPQPLPPLAQLFPDKDRPAERSLAGSTLVEYLARPYLTDSPTRAADLALLADLALDAHSEQYAKLLIHLRDHPAEIVAKMRAALSMKWPPPEQGAAREALASRQAQAAGVLLQFGDAKAIWPLLRDDPAYVSRRTYLIHALGRIGTDPSALLRHLETVADSSVRRALVLSLGEYSEDQLPAEVRGPVVTPIQRRAATCSCSHGGFPPQ